MQNKFGLKDFVLLVLLLLVGVSVWMSMLQDDRRWNELRQAETRLSEIDANLARLQRQMDAGDIGAQLEEIRQQLASGVVVSGGAAQPGSPAGLPAWAKEGYEVQTTGAWDFNTDPFDDENVETGGEFTEFFEGQPPKITPYLYADVYGRRVNDLVVEGLGAYDHETLTMRGRLAEAWQYDPEGYWLRVKIRDRARFSDGQPVTAEDVRWTHDDLLFNQEIEAERFRSVYNAIESIEVLSEKVVEFRFKEPRFDNLSQAFGFPVLPKHVYEDWTRSPATFNQSTSLLIGSGPFRMANVDINNQWTPPEDIQLVRNDLYWGPRPALAGVRFRSISDGLARLTEYGNGGGDMMRPNAEQFALMRDDEAFSEQHDLRNWFNMQGGYSFIAWQCGPRNGERLTPFNDKRVRQAMTMIIDRDRIRRDIERDLTRVATGPFLSSTPQADPDIEPWPVDLERAKQLLADAGWRDRDGSGVLKNERGDPFTWEFTFSNGSEGTLRMVNYVKDACAAVGIRVTLRPIDWSVLSTILNNRDFDAITFAWSASAPESDPNQIWHSNSIPNQGDNFVQWSSPEADRLIEKGRATLNDAERMKVWHELHRVFHDEQPYTFLSEMPWLRFTTKRMRNIQEYASGLAPAEFWISTGSQPMAN
jgi:peptide/nickel transport system substrate-binding protein